MLVHWYNNIQRILYIIYIVYIMSNVCIYNIYHYIYNDTIYAGYQNGITKVEINFQIIDTIFYSVYYEWAKRTKLLLAIIYGSRRQHSDSFKTFEKNREKLKWRFMTIFGLAELFKAMNRPNRNVLWRLTSEKNI